LATADKQRPAYPALVAAACILLVGAFAVYGLKRRIKVGDADFSSLFLLVCLSCAISGDLVITAFSRYQFTHLWKKPIRPFQKIKGKTGSTAISIYSPAFLHHPILCSRDPLVTP